MSEPNLKVNHNLIFFKNKKYINKNIKIIYF